MNFTVKNFPNSIYTWEVNCTDDSSNKNIGTATGRTLNVSVDRVAPIVYLINPQNNSVDSNGNVTFYYSFLK